MIIQEGIERMMVRDEDVFYYIALTNEKDIQPAMPEGSREGIIKGMYALSGVDEPDVHILASGRMLAEAILADQLLTNHGVKVKIWSVTSYTELAREARSKQSYGFCQASEQNPSYLKQCLADGKPIIAVSDYVTAYADLIRPHVSNPFHSLGTDGFGASDSRSHLREYFGVNAHHIALNGLFLLAQGSKRFRQMYAAYLKQSNKPNNG